MIYVESLLKVLVVGLVLGAGLPAVFALGLRGVLERVRRDRRRRHHALLPTRP